MTQHALAQLFMQRIASGLKRRSVQSCSRWAEQYRMMGKPFPGPWTFKYHPWLRAMHDCKSRVMVGQKCAQVGYTETALNKTFFNIDILGNSVLYVLPTTTPGASNFSASRFDPALSASPHIQSLFSDVKNIGHKRSGTANLFIRGSKSRSQLKELGAAFLVLDEMDEMDQANITLVLERMSGQVDKQSFYLSTPTVKGKGINKHFSDSTQDHYFFPCPCCGRYTELTFPECLIIPTDNWLDPKIHDSHLICKECNGVLPHEAKPEFLGRGRWEPTFAGRDVRGFYVNQLYSSTVDPVEMAVAYLKSRTNPADEQEFYNSKLGMVHEVEGACVTEEDIESCIANIKTRDNSPANSFVTMGVDVGKWLHFEIDQWFFDGNAAGTDVNLNAQARVLRAGKVESFEELDQLMRQYQINFCVIDANPETRKSLGFSRRFWGHLRVCYYNVGINQREINLGPEDTHKVSVDRTSWLDLSLARYRNRSIALPLDTSMEYKTNLQSLVRVYEKDRNGNPRGRYVKRDNDEDHFAHARNYSEIALRIGASQSGSRNITGVL
jgi:hypothetical protein